VEWVTGSWNSDKNVILSGKPVETTVEASRDLGFLNWHQSLRLTQVGTAVYYEEGNGQCRLKTALPRHDFSGLP
jgi:hypothetical protein